MFDLIPDDQPSKERHHDVDSAAFRLHRDRERILSLWEDRARQCVPAARAMDAPALRNSLPNLIDELIQALSESEPRHGLQQKEREIAKAHGEERSHVPAYDLSQMIEEYQVLRQVIFEVLRQDGPMSDEEQDLILDAISFGIRNASAEFVRLRQQTYHAYEAKLAQSEVQLQTIVESLQNHATEAGKKELYTMIMQAPVAMALISGPDHRFILANPLYESLVGRSVAGQTIHEAFSKEESEPFMPLLNQVYATGQAHVGTELPWPGPHAQGKAQTQYVNLGYHPFRSGDIQGVFAVVQDVTGQVVARKRVEESEGKFKTLLHSVPQIVWKLNVDLHLEFISKQYAEYTGMGEGLGVAYHPVVHPDDLGPSQQALNAAKATQSACRYMQRVRTRHGEWRWNLCQGNPIFDAAGEFAGWIGTTTDIHDQKMLAEELAQAKKEIEEKSQLLETVLQQIPTALVYAEAPSGKLRFSNEQFRKVWRHDFIASNDVEGYREYIGFHLDGRRFEGKDWPLARAITSGAIIRGEDIDVLLGDGTRGVLRLNAAPVRNAKGEIVGGVVTSEDVTEQVRSKELIARAHARLEVERTNFERLFEQSFGFVVFVNYRYP